MPDPEVVSEAWNIWRAEVAVAERLVAEAPDLDVVGTEGDFLREVLVHMIEEYARHNGHADFLHERIDGRVGQWPSRRQVCSGCCHGHRTGAGPVRATFYDRRGLAGHAMPVARTE